MLALLVPLALLLAPVQDETLAIEHVTVLPMDRDHVLEDHTVLVRDGRIAALAAERVGVVLRGRWLPAEELAAELERRAQGFEARSR